jgi:rsbT co-antagonist protein RsbR
MSDGSASILETADRYRAVFDAAPLGILVFGPECNVIDCNDALAAILQSRRERVIGLNLRRIPDQRILPAIEKALAGEEGFYQGPYRSATSGAEIVAVLKSRPMRDADGVIRGGIGVVEDATDRVRVEEELRKQLEVVQEQSATIHALGTPILKVWEGVLCLPIIGAVSMERIAEMTETMLQAIIDERSHFAIIDLTGVDTVDTTTAAHLMQLFRSAQLVGAEGLLCGLRPAVAQTIVALGGEMRGIRTLRTMQEALRYCLHALEQQAY